MDVAGNTWDTLLLRVHIATMTEPRGYGIIEDGAIGLQAGRLAWLGPMALLPDAPERLAADVMDGQYAWVTPGLIDAHALLLPEGEGTDEETVLAAAGHRLLIGAREGVTAVALPSPTEAQQALARRLESLCPVRILASDFPAVVPTYHAATDIPEPEEEDIRAMAEIGAAALLLPGWFHIGYTRHKPPLDLLRRYGIPLIVATGYHAERAPVDSLLLMLNMACALFGLTPEEALCAATINPARALGVEAEIGALTVGKKADIALWDIPHPDALALTIGGNPCIGVVKDGRLHRVK